MSKMGVGAIRNRMQKRHFLKTISFCICLLTFILTAGILLHWWIEGNKAIEVNEKLMKEVVFTSNVDVQGEAGSLFEVDFEKLKAINKDATSWIRIPKTNISYPIVQAEDNAFYLKHNIHKKSSSSGTLFMDYKNHTDFSDVNTVIYGHNMKNGTMFAELKNLDSLGCDTIQIYLPGEVRNYKIFSIYTIEAEDYSIQTSVGEEQRTAFVQTLKNRSRKNYGLDLEDKPILTLSTCHTDNHRTLVHAILE